jgi:hypothetical protein
VDRTSFHPSGLIVRKGPGAARRFATRDPATGREVSLGGDWQMAYERWLAIRRASTVVPDPLRVIWLITEFSERHRPAGNKERCLFAKETRLLVRYLLDLGDPLVDALRASDGETFRMIPGVGPIGRETLIRRLRQIWRWALVEGLTHRECPWIARTQEHAIRVEVVDIVARHLPQDILHVIDSMNTLTPAHAREGTGLAYRSLSAAVRQAARRACLQMQRDGRPDLIPALRRCELAWFLEAPPSNTPGGPSGAELLVGHARTDRVRDLRTKVSTKQKRITLESGTSGDVR